ncbi:MAG TPA: phosphatase PAP2 family protein [Verrucomicrobiae bacterium]|nr:phosphatase PAP2 family protein [Verrucomicrobiae bacterium]
MYEEIISIAGEYLIYLLPFIGLAAWLVLPKQRKFRMAWHGMIAVGLGFLIAFIAGELVYNPRPFVTLNIEPIFYHEADNGFPSTHMLAASLIAGVTYLSSRKFGIVMMICAAAIGTSRVLAYVHSWTDILASALIVAISVFAAHWIVARLPKRIVYLGTTDPV